ncbi:glycosyltransferase family 4 protein [bacterium]|nr:glycosyltransferase family 4 protein [bacterium]
MKTVIITSSFPLNRDDYSGIFVLNHAKQLKGEIWVVAPHHLNTPFYELIDNIKVIRLPYHLPKYENFFYGQGVFENLKKSKFNFYKGVIYLSEILMFLIFFLKDDDILYSHWIFPTGFIGSILKKLKKIEHKIVVHSAGISLLKKFGLKTIAKFITKNTDSIQFVNSIHKEWLELLIDNSIEYNYTFSPMPADKNLFLDYKKNLKFRKILFIGRLIPIKGVREMLSSIPNIIGSNDWSITIAGDGPLLEELKVEFPTISFVGKVNFNQKKQLLEESDIVIIPSIATNAQIEGFPTVILEALYTQNLVIISDSIIGNSYFFEKDEIVIYSKKDGELENLLQNIKKNAILYNKIADKGAKKVNKIFKNSE